MTPLPHHRGKDQEILPTGLLPGFMNHLLGHRKQRIEEVRAKLRAKRFGKQARAAWLPHLQARLQRLLQPLTSLLFLPLVSFYTTAALVAILSLEGNVQA